MGQETWGPKSDLYDLPHGSGRLSMVERDMSESTSKSKGITPGTVIHGCALGEYQDGSIVSRIVSKEPSGNITFFAFDEGQALSEHTAPFNALVQVIDGEAQITIAGEAHRVVAGEMILLPANVPHALDATTRFKMILTMIRS